MLWESVRKGGLVFPRLGNGETRHTIGCVAYLKVLFHIRHILWAWLIWSSSVPEAYCWRSSVWCDRDIWSPAICFWDWAWPNHSCPNTHCIQSGIMLKWVRGGVGIWKWDKSGPKTPYGCLHCSSFWTVHRDGTIGIRSSPGFTYSEEPADSVGPVADSLPPKPMQRTLICTNEEEDGQISGDDDYDEDDVKIETSQKNWLGMTLGMDQAIK